MNEPRSVLAAIGTTGRGGAPSALIPLDAPFVDGMRYRMAGATDARNRLDLYVADTTGPWVRRHGVLLAAAAIAQSAGQRPPAD